MGNSRMPDLSRDESWIKRGEVIVRRPGGAAQGGEQSRESSGACGGESGGIQACPHRAHHGTRDTGKARPPLPIGSPVGAGSSAVLGCGGSGVYIASSEGAMVAISTGSMVRPVLEGRGRGDVVIGSFCIPLGCRAGEGLQSISLCRPSPFRARAARSPVHR